LNQPFAGLRAWEICKLRRNQVKLSKQSDFLKLVGKRNKYHEILLNAIARKVQEKYLLTLTLDAHFLFSSVGFDKENLVGACPGVHGEKICIFRKAKLMVVHMICVSVSAIVWLKQFHCTD